jgi:LPS-assembly protein
MNLGGFIRRFGAGIGGCAVVVGACLGLMVLAPPASAEDLGLGGIGSSKVAPGTQMLVEADDLVYDYDRKTVSAIGNVKIYYSGYTLEAEKVTYIQSTGKLIATGRVKLIDPSGVVAYAEDLDITEDFRDGFVQSLRVDTPDQTHFAAESAERTDGERTVFINGVYTACEPCKDNPAKPPLWQVKATKIVVDQKTKTIAFHNAVFEFGGIPVAWIPYFTTADPSVKRKTGFLAPTVGYSNALGWSVTTPYYIALAPNYDVTLTPTYFSEQGFLGEAEYRQRFANGQFTIRAAGISQDDPKAFLTPQGGGTFAQRDFRGGVRTTGEFALNRWWTVGWDGTLTTDRTFTRNYGVLNSNQVFATSEIHLTGLRDTNYFNMQAEYFQVLTDKTEPKYSQGRQAVISPIVDHNYIFDNPVLGGQLSLTSNLTVLTRDEDDPFMVLGDTYYHGLAGNFARLTHEIEWERKMIGPMGVVVTPFASLRGDVYALDPTATVPPQLTTASTPGRFMPAAGVELSLPVIATAGASTHVFEPIAQIITRPDEPLAGKLPNDDAQSLVFDDTILFERDKFTGYDRVEGGTVVNAGLRYVGTFSNGMTVESLAGQSYHIAGRNSFATKDLADTGAFSGLQTDVSDYVARVSLDTGTGTRLTLRGRFDEKDLTVNMGQAEATTTIGALTTSATYIYTREIPEAGVTTPTSQATASASLNIGERWRIFGSAVFDLDAASLAKDSVGIAFDDTCLSLSIAYSETRGTDIPSQQVMVRVLLRTLAEGNASASISGGGGTGAVAND